MCGGRRIYRLDADFFSSYLPLPRGSYIISYMSLGTVFNLPLPQSALHTYVTYRYGAS